MVSLECSEVVAQVFQQFLRVNVVRERVQGLLHGGIALLEVPDLKEQTDISCCAEGSDYQAQAKHVHNAVKDPHGPGSKYEAIFLRIFELLNSE